MRTTLKLSAALFSLHLLAGMASAQWCGYYQPPRAPDFQNTPPFWYKTAYGMVYGPNYYVYPKFQPFQGMLPGPNGLPCNPYGMYGGYCAAMPGIAAFPNHLYARSPRDYFMVDTDPRTSPFTYGLSGLGGGYTATAPVSTEP